MHLLTINVKHTDLKQKIMTIDWYSYCITVSLYHPQTSLFNKNLRYEVRLNQPFGCILFEPFVMLLFRVDFSFERLRAQSN